jgi:hypothetical protein
MTEKTGLIYSSDATIANTADEQVIALRALLKLSPSERDRMLTQQVVSIADYFTPGSEEMEWAEKYVENGSWVDE